MTTIASFSVPKDSTIIGNICGYDHSPIQAGDAAVFCPVCQTPHHATCWTSNGNKCTLMGCEGSGIIVGNDATITTGQPPGPVWAPTVPGPPPPPPSPPPGRPFNWLAAAAWGLAVIVMGFVLFRLIGGAIESFEPEVVVVVDEVTPTADANAIVEPTSSLSTSGISTAETGTVADDAANEAEAVDPLPNVTDLSGGPQPIDTQQIELPGGLIVEQVFVPTGSFLMGSESGDPDEQPIHTVQLSSFWIDRQEVTNGQYADCVNEGTCAPPLATSSYSRPDYTTNPAYSHYPAIHVNWEMAMEYCQWQGGRLPTEAEWEYAALNNQGQSYPWGGAISGGKANFCDAECNPNFSWRDTGVNDGQAELAPVGAYPAGASWVGALDMAGNVYEWVYDSYESDYYAISPSDDPVNESATSAGRVLRGGSWFDRAAFLRSANRLEFAAGGSGDNIGFRCVSRQEAATVAEIPAITRAVPAATVSAPPLPPPTETAQLPTQPPSPLPATSPPPTPLPTPQQVTCAPGPGDRWGPTLWAAHRERLGCPLNQETRTNAAYQYYERGLTVWRQDADRIYVLYDNGRYSSFPDDSPSGFHESDLVKGGFGYLWRNNSAVREGLGQPLAIEFNATNFAVQDFAGGTIFYFFENDARNYILFADEGRWMSTQQ